MPVKTRRMSNQATLFIALLLLIICCPFAARSDERPYDMELVGGGAVIARDGPKTGFPSVVRVPDWIPTEQRAHPQARYYLYYGTHHGDHIMMKWAASLHGPWEEYHLGGRFHYFTRRGVLDLRSDPLRDSFGHIAAPDVHVDQEHKQFIMFFHGENQPATITPNGTAVPRRHENFVATSSNGLNFNDPISCGGQPGFGPKTVTVDGVTRDVWIGSEYQRAFHHRGEWYSLSKRAVIGKARNSSDPFAANPQDPFGMAWIEAHQPTPLWKRDASGVQPTYFSPATAFLASSEFENHPHNPHPGVRILSRGERLNHLSVCLLNDHQLEVFFYIRGDPEDRYPSIYRVIYNIQDADFQKWDVARDANGKVIFDTVVTPSEVMNAVRKSHPNLKPMYHADPVSFGSSGIFVDTDGQKYLFFAYVSQKFSGEEGEGQISAIRLIPRVGAY